MRLNDRPVDCRERYQRNVTVREVLFVFERLVACYQNIETGSFRGVQEIAVFQAAPAHECDRERLMMSKEKPQVVRDVLVQ